MPEKTQFVKGGFYLISAHGGKGEVFACDEDKERFLKLLYVVNSTKPFVFKHIKDTPLTSLRRGATLLDIGAYSLGADRVHMLVKVKNPKNVRVFTGKLLTSYSKYFNLKNRRQGRLFVSLDVKHVADIEDFKYVFAWMHLEPLSIIESRWNQGKGITLKKGFENAKRFIENYPYSSMYDYIGKSRDELLIVNPGVLPGSCARFGGLQDFVDDYFLFKKSRGADKKAPTEGVSSSVVSDGTSIFKILKDFRIGGRKILSKIKEKRKLIQ